jgi:hypothetical protein
MQGTCSEAAPFEVILISIPIHGCKRIMIGSAVFEISSW